MLLATGKFPYEPCINSAKQDIAILGTLPYAWYVVQYPFHTAGRKIGVREKSGTLLNCSLVTLVYQFLAECCATATLPQNGRIDRLTCIPVPYHNRLTLVYQRNGECCVSVLRQVQLLYCSYGIVIYLLCISFSPVFLGMVNLMGNYPVIDQIKLVVKQQRL